jgi:hypothetical protein
MIQAAAVFRSEALFAGAASRVGGCDVALRNNRPGRVAINKNEVALLVVRPVGQGDRGDRVDVVDAVTQLEGE